MKKVLLAGAALMLAGGIYSTASAAAVTPGVVVEGDARVRLWYKSVEYSNTFGNAVGDYGSQTNMDSRIRINITGTTAGGTYAKLRIRAMEGLMGNMDTDLNGINNLQQNNLWADLAYVGIPFNDMFTLEVGKYRSTYGPLPTTYNFFYDDVQLTGLRGIVKVNDKITINPFVEWMNEAQNSGATSAFVTTTNTAYDKSKDNDEYRIGAHVKAKVNKDWTVGGMLGYQVDNRTDNAAGGVAIQQGNQGLFGSIYTNGKANAFGLVGEVSYTAAKLNAFNTWAEDQNGASTVSDSIGSKNDGYGGYIFPNYQIDKLNLGLNLGFTTGGFRPDLAFGFVMIGGKDNSVIGDSVKIGDTGDWLWAGFVPSYAINDSLKLTGNLVYASINKWKDAPLANGTGGGPAGGSSIPLSNAWELSAVLQYTLTKGTDLYFSAGYLKPTWDSTNFAGISQSALKNDGELGAATRLEVKF